MQTLMQQSGQHQHLLLLGSRSCLSGARANAINVIQSKATAYVVNSNLSATGTNTSLDVRAGDIDVLASNMASITALILTSSGSVGGGGVGVAGSIGVGISRNYIGYDSNGESIDGS